MFRGGLKLGFSQAFVQGCSFIRNVIVARLISPEDFGIAATFAMTFFLLEMISNLAADVLLVQAPDGDQPEFQKSAQALHAFRGTVNAAIIFVLAGPIANLFGVPQARWAFHCLALLPLCKALNHLDNNRLQREMNFGPQIASDIGSNLLVTLLALPLGLWLRDYSLMLWLLIAQVASFMILSHLMAKRRYAWAWHADYVKRIVAFGWPLLINGLLMYVIFQGDRFIIGASKRLFAHSTYTLTDLGIYSVAFGLTMAPTMLVANVSTQLFLPLLSRAQEMKEQFERRYAGCSELMSLVAAAIAIPFILAGGWAVTLVYGAKYAAAAGFIGWLGAMWALRILRVAPTLAAMARGDTRNSMVSNMARTIALAGILFVAATGRPLVWVAICGFVGELLALTVCLWRLQREHGVSSRIALKPFMAAGASMMLAGMAVMAGVPQMGWVAACAVALALTLLSVVAMLIMFPEVRTGLQMVLQRDKATSAAAGVVAPVNQS